MQTGVISFSRPMEPKAAQLAAAALAAEGAGARPLPVPFRVRAAEESVRICASLAAERARPRSFWEPEPEPFAPFSNLRQKARHTFGAVPLPAVACVTALIALLGLVMVADRPGSMAEAAMPVQMAATSPVEGSL